MGVLPVKRNSGGVDGDASFLFFWITIGFGRAFIDKSHSMLGTAVKKHPFGNGGLAGIDVGDDSQVPQVFELSEHGFFYGGRAN